MEPKHITLGHHDKTYMIYYIHLTITQLKQFNRTIEIVSRSPTSKCHYDYASHGFHVKNSSVTVNVIV